MTIAPMELAYIPMNDRAAFDDWLREHGNLHNRLKDIAIRQGHLDLGTFPVFDFIKEAKEDWLCGHDQDHRNIAATFNLAGVPDLTYLDFEDPTNWNNWHYAHALVHESERKAVIDA